ncbi:gamma carbonic anhydrase family protein [Microbacterium sp. cx-55]|uniref:gamma carbonic anhydrase family protein n=1 Tax=Microbacterium sp. cx-55 TaxID=2875948 RepID=UPI001CC0BD83|nr:gamma carbonic anhydrase family protein [Microbacterium sp. cx-55]UGB34843.1 gamma carbonic anhydrase family protein [Microbacterium sp. cx-55]
MLIRHRDCEPTIDPTAYVAPSAVIVGAVRIEAGARILHGAVITAEDGEVTIGENTVVMEHALIRGRSGHPVRIGAAVMIGPHAHVNGSVVEDEVFVATGASLFPGSRIGRGAEIRINAVVHVNTVLEPGAVVPIGWVAVGEPASILPPERHDEIWAIQRQLNFGGTVYGIGPAVSMRELMRQQSAFYGAHLEDRAIDEEDRCRIDGVDQIDSTSGGALTGGDGGI